MEAYKSKIISPEKAKVLREQLRKDGKTIAFSNGCYDMLHVGHVASLAFAKSQADYLFVGVNSDRSVKLNKGEGRPIIPEKERALMLAALVAVDYVVIFEEKEVLPLIKLLKPDILIKGQDRAGEVVGQEYVESYGGQVRLAPTVRGFSTTKLIERVLISYHNDLKRR